MLYAAALSKSLLRVLARGGDFPFMCASATWDWLPPKLSIHDVAGLTRC